MERQSRIVVSWEIRKRDHLKVRYFTKAPRPPSEICVVAVGRGGKLEKTAERTYHSPVCQAL